MLIYLDGIPKKESEVEKVNTITTIRIDSELLEKIKTYSEIAGCSQTDFINALVTDAFEKYIIQRSGGAILTLPNPQNYSIDADKAHAALSVLCDAAASINKLNANLPIPLFAILAFFEQRLFYEPPEIKEHFKMNLIIDSTQGEPLAENTNSVGKED